MEIHGMQCPRCQSELETIEVDGIELESCPECGGLWFDQGELRRAKDLALPDLHWKEFEIWKHEHHFDATADGLACPRCRQPMVHLRYHETEVEIDHCPACSGVWLGRGELEAIVLALQDESSSMSLPELLKETLQEGLEVVRGHEKLATEWGDLKQILNLIKLRLLVARPGLRKALLAVQQNSPLT